MTDPQGSIALEVVTRSGRSTDETAHFCRLAGRLGYRVTWIALGGPPDLGVLRELVAAAKPAAVGVLLTHVNQHLDWLAGSRDSADLNRIQIDAGDLRRDDGLDVSLGGRSARARRVHSSVFDPGNAGFVVRSADRGDALRALRDAHDMRQVAGRPPRLTVDVPVVIGRTLGEAEARLQRDQWLAEVRDPRRSGLFGTFADAQAHTLQFIHAGADTIRASLADEADVADLLAQLRAVTVGPTLLARNSDPLSGRPVVGRT